MSRTVVVAVVTVVTAACARTSGDPGDLRVVPLAGEVRLVDGGASVLLDDEASVEPGDVVATGPAGRALVDLGLGGRLEIDGQAAIRVAPEPEVLRGSVLATADPGGLVVTAGDAEVEAREAVFRVDRGFSVTVAVYRGAAEILGSGIGSLPALRQAVVVAGGIVPRGAQPLAVRADHLWDIRLLGGAIDLGIDLVRLERGLTRALPPNDQEAMLAQALQGIVSRSVLEEALTRLRAAETVVAAEVSRAAADLSGASVARILADVLDLRGQGAHWIVVAATWRLSGTAVLDGLEAVVGALERLVGPRSPAGQAGGAGGAGSGGDARGGGTGGGGGGSTGGGSFGTGGSGDGGTTGGGTTGGGTTGGDGTGSGTTGSAGGGTTGGSGGGSGGSGGSGGGSGGSGGSGGGSGGPPVPGQGCNSDVGCVVDEVVEDLEAGVDDVGGALP
jgi:hypothetical protein